MAEGAEADVDARDEQEKLAPVTIFLGTTDVLARRCRPARKSLPSELESSGGMAGGMKTVVPYLDEVRGEHVLHKTGEQLGSRERDVSEQDLQGPEVGACFEQVGRETVAQRMRRERLGHARASRCGEGTDP